MESSSPSAAVAFSADWGQLELNPNVIGPYVRTLGGPQNVYFCDILLTEDRALEAVPMPVYAVLLVYLMKSIQNVGCDSNQTEDASHENLWFTKQVSRMTHKEIRN